MFFSEGQSCPVCKKAFQKEDDVVVCPVCGAPHHRACYHEVGHCCFEDTHGTNEQWSREKAEKAEKAQKSSSAFSTKRCPHCGFDNPAFAEFCGHCGRPVEPETNFDNENKPRSSAPFDKNFREFTYVPFHAATQNTGGVDPDFLIGGERAEDVAKMVGVNQAYYMPTFKKFEESGSELKWNWAAFFFGPYWLLFRKCNLIGGLTFCVTLLLSAVSSYIQAAKMHIQTIAPAELMSTLESYSVPGHPMYKYVLIVSVLFLVSVLLRVFFGLCGNAIYKHSCLKKIRTSGKDPYASSTMPGGISFGLPVYAFFISELFQLFLNNLLS